MKQNNINKITFAGVAVAGLLIVGCQTDQSSVTDFFPDDEARSTQNFMTAQAAAGARADATLQPMHFDGDHLNSLGESKLDLLLKDDDTSNMVVVYMNVPADDENLKVRRDAVVTYFEDRGVSKDSIEFKAGGNPAQTSLAAEHLGRISKT
ncbi:MAG: hypothetical protein H7Z14_02590, partial [Anaerolineae bacterium]|nr:hypothetical protein [Phycisphaerae bacterium]